METINSRKILNLKVFLPFIKEKDLFISHNMNQIQENENIL